MGTFPRGTAPVRNVPSGTVPRGTSPRKTLHPWYVTGFVEGEGTFTYSRSGHSLVLYLVIKLPDGESEVLGQIQRFFGGIGRIYRQKPRISTRRSGRTKAASIWRVARIDQHLRVLEHFKEFPLQGPKRVPFSIWERMVRMKREHPRRAAWDDLNELATQLSAAASRKKPAKRA